MTAQKMPFSSPRLVDPILLVFGCSLVSQGSTEKPLLLPEVLASVKKQYPPFLAALIDQDIAKGRIRQALGSFITDCP